MRSNGFSNPREIPDIDVIDQWDKQRQEATDAIEIIDNKAICQSCSQAIPIFGKLQRPKGDRVSILEKRIKHLQAYPYGNNDDSIKQLKEELAQLEAQDANWEKLRSLPLYSSRITGFKFVCSKCYDCFYQIAQEERKKKA